VTTSKRSLCGNLWRESIVLYLWLAYTATLLIDVFCRIDRDELTELIARSSSTLTPTEVAKLVRARTQLV
jgi:hypothetical protein